MRKESDPVIYVGEVHEDNLIHSENYRDDFPFFDANDGLAYLDSAASTQKPEKVIDAISVYNSYHHANIHRGAYDLSIKATEGYDHVRDHVKEFIGAGAREEIIFTKGTTESINLLAYSYGEQLKPGDEIIVSILEHHSNLVPWQQLALRKGLKLTYLYVNPLGVIPDSELTKIKSGVKLVAVTMMSNAIGVKTPIEAIVDKAHEVGALVLADGAQYVPHHKIDVEALDIDFLVFSGHKMMASTGIGVLYGKKALLETLSPFHYGGDMIEYVEEQVTTFAPLPERLEAGTPNIEGVISLGAAMTYIDKVGLDFIHKKEQLLTAYALERLGELPDIELIGSKELSLKGPVISFNVKDVHSHDTAFILDNHKVAIRSGHHCAQPLMKYLKVPSTARASFYFYNTYDEIDQLVEGLKGVRRLLGYGS